MADYYISIWGNDENDGTSWEFSKRSLQGAYDAYGYSHNFHLQGYFIETSYLRNMYGPDIGYAILDGTFIPYLVSEQYSVIQNCIVQNYANLINTGNRYLRYQYNCIFRNMGSYGVSSFDNVQTHTNVLCYNINTIYIGQTSALSHRTKSTYSANTLIRFVTAAADGYSRDCIFKSPQYLFSAPATLQYCLIFDGTFQFNGGGLGNDETVYSAPSGVSDADKLEDLRSRMATVYGGLSSDYLVGCQYYSNPSSEIFVNEAVGDYSLVPNCLAAHMNFYADFIGFSREGVKAEWNTDFTNIVNVDSNGNTIDQETDATFETNIIDLSHVRNVMSINNLGLQAYRNGQQINTVSNLGSEITAGSNVLTDNSIYMCIDDVITLDDLVSTSREPWETFVAQEVGTPGVGWGLGFSGNGKVQEVLLDSYEPKIQFKASKTDPTLASAVLVTSYLNSSPIMVNVDGSGEPLYSDADPGYDVGTAVPLYTRYIKYFTKIKANNLPAR